MLQIEPSALDAIAVDDIESEYYARGIDGWSDAALVDAVGSVVSLPRRDPADSFVLHAPLELAARAALLPRVHPGQRTLARLHVLAIAAQYQAAGEPYKRPVPDVDEPAVHRSEADLVTSLCSAVGSGDLEATDLAARAVAAVLPADRLAVALADPLIPLTAAAAHAPIFLHHLTRSHPLGGLRRDLLAPLSRELARQPEWRLRWMDERAPGRGPTDPELLAAALADTPPMGVPGSVFIHPLLMQVDESDVAATHLGDTLGCYNRSAAHACLRVAARSMLAETPEHAPYGWTHCLTIPQAVLAVGRRGREKDRALAVAATQVMAFRAALSTRELSPGVGADLPRFDPDELATAASIRHDAHIVKYVLACLDAAHEDPVESGLYHAAARRLLDVWADMGGDPADPLTR